MSTLSRESRKCLILKIRWILIIPVLVAQPSLGKKFPSFENSWKFSYELKNSVSLELCLKFFKQEKEGYESELIYSRPNNLESKGRWEIGFSVAENGFEQTSFVNSISTSKGEKFYCIYM